MAGVTWSRNPNELVGIIETWVDDLEDRTEKVVEQAVAVGQSSMIRQQRVDTGHMRSEISAQTERTGNTITGEWGWLDDEEDYFYYQDAGFRHVGGQWVEGMFSIRSSLDEAEEILRDWI